MPRASARHNYSPEPSDDGMVVAPGVIHRWFMAERWRNPRHAGHETGEAEAIAPIEPRPADGAPVPPTGYPHPHVRLTRHVTAQPPPPRGDARAALLARIAWLRIYRRRDEVRTNRDNDVETVWR